MPRFTSKIQHKTYEKGEFSDEQERELAATIDLINTFPWDKERTLTDIQLTGPSVTVKDEGGNYLKIGLYFNGKYCLYYLDNDGHLYEYHTPDLKQVNTLVTGFFKAALDLSAFEKHFINIGNRAHFKTNPFIYRERLGRIVSLTAYLLLYSVFFISTNIAVIMTDTPWHLGLLFALLSLFLYYFIFRIYRNAYLNRDNYLQISRGNDVFSFGYTADTIKSYNKADIKEMISYANRGSRNPNMIEAIEVIFKNGETIRFTNMLISTSDFQAKFHDSMGNQTFPFSIGKKGLWNIL